MGSDEHVCDLEASSIKLAQGMLFLHSTIPKAQAASLHYRPSRRCSKFLSSGCASGLSVQVLPALRFSMATKQDQLAFTLPSAQVFLVLPYSPYLPVSLEYTGPRGAGRSRAGPLHPSVGRTKPASIFPITVQLSSSYLIEILLGRTVQCKVSSFFHSLVNS